ncbi:carbohydrate ABC transporter permease [Haloferax volcanii]|uniref:Sugar ABC transporter permease n=6 Tax=Haloferax TaxID=2251 RepID=A0A384KUZ1_HALVD|nr:MULTISPECIES: carbohydrate ABC transporter permease [Haloferax]ADE01281.1 ABC-type transport system permease protein (probable substrate sugar) [Haloferax volcanii DS2]ELY36350.1 sugar ABC transporter permease [Haloferax volcanii DS2]ELZ77633.1 sugar ABC transporter permease [Haloferax lucentense DSM 14919]ELZ95756.1 sugar ABC transporter permease [Haloferax alexandrinus JCM 10717]MBS8120401.1 carbohydrate ABC transporter permease [Haloferax volcanii]
MTETTSQDSIRARLDGDTVRNVLLHAFLYGLAVLMAVPYLYTLSRSFQPTELLRDPRPYWIPPLAGEPITLEHYQYLLNNTLVVEWTINTFIIAAGATLLIVVIDSMIAFSLTRLDWPGQGLVMGVILASFMVPYYMNIVPLYQIVSDLGLINTYWGVILPAVASPLGVFLLYQFFKDIPAEYEEAARLDGFTTFQVYTRIILPLAKPILSALALFMFVYNWNAFLWPLLVLSNETAYTLPIGLVNLYQGNIDTPGLHMAVAILGSLPLFIIYLIFQGQIVRAVQMQGATG